MLTILLTGANRGLGLEFARQYAAEGHTVIAACREPQKAAALRRLADAHKSLRVEKLDVGDEASIHALATKLEGIELDLLINNAGILSGPSAHTAPGQKDRSQNFGEIDPVAWSEVFQINAIAPVMVLQMFVNHLAATSEPKVVNITSRMGSIAGTGPGHIAYRSSKAALNAAMCTLATDLAERKIAWVNLHPGWVKTDMGGSGADITPETSIQGMRALIQKLTLKTTGQFLGYDGKIIPW